MRARARWAIAPLLAAPTGAWALGLGDIELRSALNQPFRADIALSATSDELQSLRISLAGADTFEKYGLDRPAFLSAFTFRVATNSAGRNVIEVSSSTSVAEPFVTLLVEATWPRGRTLREYTVLLDPPVLLPAPAAPPAVQPAETRTSGGAGGGQIDRPARTTSPAPTPEPAAPARPVSPPAANEPAPGPVSNATSSSSAPRPRAVAPGGTYGPVQRAETLWAIAERARPADVTINQMMIAIYQANAAAFGGNINVLRAGATLRIPDTADLSTLTRIAANAEVQRQTDEWPNRPRRGPAASLADRHAGDGGTQQRACTGARAGPRRGPATAFDQYGCSCRSGCCLRSGRRRGEPSSARAPQRGAAEPSAAGCRRRRNRSRARGRGGCVARCRSRECLPTRSRRPPSMTSRP